MKKNKRKKRFFLCLVVLGILTGSMAWGIYEIKASIPDELYIVQNDKNALDSIIKSPFITTSDTITASSGGKYVIECRLFDLFMIKKVTISQAQPVRVGVSGDTIGIYMETKGILVIDTQEILNSQGKNEEPAKNLIQPGDYIEKIDGIDIDKKSELISKMKDNNGEDVVLEINRDGSNHSVSVEPVCCQDGSYKLGIWVRDNTQGIGTLTYIQEDGSFGALGHGISDLDMGDLLKLDQGDLYRAEVVSIKKGSTGSPGELAGIIHYNEKEHLGKIQVNGLCGIYGIIDLKTVNGEIWRSGVMSNGTQESGIADNDTQRSETINDRILDEIGNWGLELTWYEVGFKQDMQEGPATILCNIGNGIQEYKINIEDICWNATDTNKCFVVEVTDPELISETGGIVQGMSGSPIIQDGKLVGAVTHVLVNDPTRGYGIFIENMLDAVE
ncbi:MAG: PDZ domain-containing protein [Lachnospiraceae bacterium]|nr:PDZ domain-containing protein [Lachnospiraceae bacterium]